MSEDHAGPDAPTTPPARCPHCSARLAGDVCGRCVAAREALGFAPTDAPKPTPRG